MVATLGATRVGDVPGSALWLPGWFVTRTPPLYQLPLASRKLRVVTDWTVSLCFRRDIAELSMLGHARGLSRERREAASTISVTSSTRGGEGVD
jgi:NADH dehydrogenase